MGTAVVATGYGSESFLSSSIPLQANKMKRKHKRILVPERLSWSRNKVSMKEILLVLSIQKTWDWINILKKTHEATEHSFMKTKIHARTLLIRK